MKKILLLGIIICQCLVLFAGVSFAETSIPPKKVGVLELDNKTPYSQLGKLSSAAIMVHLLKNKSCEIIDQDTLAAAFIQRGVKSSGVIDPAIASSIGESLGLDYIIMGNLVSVSSYTIPGYWIQGKYGPQYVQGSSGSSAKFEVVMIDTKTGQIVWMKNISGGAEGLQFSGAIEDGGYRIVQHIYPFVPLQGTITKIEGKKYFIDLNKNNGIEKSDLFSPGIPVSPETPVIPATSVIPGMPSPDEKEPVVLKIIEVGDTYCVAVLIGGEAKDIKPGIIVSRHFKTAKGMLWFRKIEKLDQNTK